MDVGRDRGPPRLLDDGSTPFGDGLCPPESEVGWNVSAYNVGGPGRVYLALVANGEPVKIQVIDVEGDQPVETQMSWVPQHLKEYEVMVGWDLDGNFSPTDHGEGLVAPVRMKTGCWR